MSFVHAREGHVTFNVMSLMTPSAEATTPRPETAAECPVGSTTKMHIMDPSFG
jgi:hypothetical protein